MKKFTLVLFCTLTISTLYGQLFINEAMSANESTIQDEAGQYDDWIEIYNAGPNPIDLQNYFLSDNATNPEKWEVTTSVVVPAGGYVIFWADEDQPQGPTHTNFKLNSNGETVMLTNSAGSLIDQITIPALDDDNSYGRVTDGSGTLQVFEISSPDASNATGSGALTSPLITPPTGVYTNTQTVSITADPGTTIHYTIDGSTPTNTSPVYSGPISVSNSASVRAVAVKAGFSDSEIALHSYILNPTTDLPIVHVTIDPMYLWDDVVGMHVSGTNGIPGNCSMDPRNWNQDWEYQANATLYETDGTVGFSEGVGLSISGGCSRNGAKKSFNVSFKSEFGKKSLDYKLFEYRDETKFQGFKLRSGGNGRDNYRIMESSGHLLIEDQLDIDHQATRPVAMYLNGEYWGLFFIRDRTNKGFIDTYHKKLNKDSLDLIRIPRADGTAIWHLIERVSEGTNTAYYALDDFASNNSLANSSNYDYVKTQVDINSYLDYIITNIYYNNLDWPGNNLKVWREHSTESKWRWIMFDNEKFLISGGASNTILLDQVLNHPTNTTQRNPVAANLIRQLMQNPEFEAEYIQRANTYIQTVWEPSRVASIFFDYKNLVANEIQADHNKWTSAWDFATWDARVDEINDYFVDRPDYYRTMVDNVLAVSGRVDVTFNVNANTNGSVKLHSNYFQIPASYTGTYHADVPFEIHAIPNPGYRFSHWQETGSTDATLYQSFTSNTTLTPVFVPSLDLVINEIHYNPNGSSEAAEFVEIYNPDSNAKPLHLFEFGEGICFEFPEGATIGPGEYIVIANDASLYEGNGYQVFEYDFSNLDNDGEHLSLINRNNQVIDSLTYNDGGDWIGVADGGFYSLALLNHPLDNALASSWDVQSVYITPGAANQFLPFDTYHTPSDVVINEIHYHPFISITPAGDTISSKNYEFIEIKNLTGSPVSLNGVAFSRGITYEFPTGSVLPANGFIVLAEDSLEYIDRYGHAPFGIYEGKLSNSGEMIWLSDQTGQLLDAVRYDDVFPWNAQADGGLVDYSLALVDGDFTNDSYLNWTIQCNLLHTPGTVNDLSCFTGIDYSGLTINEIDYLPNGTNALEFLEIINNGFLPVDLEALHFSTGINYEFNGGILLPGQFYLIARDSTLFENTYNVSVDGEWLGGLSSNGETIILSDFFGNAIDIVSYGTSALWTNEPAQGIKSLALIDPNLDNNDGSNWCVQQPNRTPKAPNIFSDTDNDNILDCIDSCPTLDDSLIGTTCDDGDLCTTGEKWDSNCNCSGGTFQDTDNDGVCDAEDQCSGINDGLIGTACDDGDPCTVNEVFDTNCQCSGGVYTDSDNDGTCDGLDQCPSFNDNLIGQSCNDNDPCTTNDVYNTSCNCTGTAATDSDGDGICDATDQCPNFNNNLIGTPCDDGIICFVGSTWDSNCNCTGGAYVDSDGDNVCDPLDACPGFDDNIDSNNNGIPDSCEGCVDYITETSNSLISQDRSANISIQSNGRVLIGDIEYHAGDEVILTSGFEVKSGAVFHAFIAPCN
jgi:hypothetical protein